MHIRPFTECLVCAHPVHSDFRLSEPVDCHVNNLENGVILSYINNEIKIVTIQKSVLYNDGNLVIILSAFFSPESDRNKRLSRFCKRYLQYYMIASQARFLSFGHSHYTYIRLHSPTLSLIKFVLEKVILLSWLLIVVQFYTRSQDLLKVTWEVSRHGLASDTAGARRNNSSAKNCLRRLTEYWSWPIMCLHDKNISFQSSV